MSSDRYFGTHRAPAQRPGRFAVSRRDAVWMAALVVVAILGPAAAYAITTPTYTDQCIRTPKDNGGLILECDPIAGPSPSGSPSTSPSSSPSPSPSASVSPSPSVSPSASPSTSASPTPTTPAPSPSASPSPSPSPSPTPPPTTPPPGPRVNCFGTTADVFDQAALAGCGYVTIATTGVPAGTALVPFVGDYYARTAGAVISNMDLDGCLYVVASGVTIKNTRVRMADRCFYGLSTYDVAGSGLTTIDHVEVVCNYAHGSAIAGPGLRVSRVYVHGCENGFEVNGNSVIADSWIEGTENPKRGNDPHGDDIQSQGGNNVTIRHNTFGGHGPITSSIITNPTANNGWVIEDNALSAGAFTLYCPEQGTNFVVRNNRFMTYRNPPIGTGKLLYKDLGDDRAPAYGHTDACNHAGIIWSGNIDDLGRSVPAGGLN